MNPMRTLPLCFALLLGCPADGSDDATEDSAVAGTTESDISTLTGAADAIGGALDDLDVAVTLAEGSVAGLGDCVWDYVVEGTPTAGTIEMALATTPCGGATSVDGASGTYTVTAGSISGTYSGDGTTWTLDLSGERDASIEVETVRRGARSYDVSWTLDPLTAETDGASVASFTIGLVYDGVGDRVWTLDVDGDDSSITGTLTGPNGGSCTVTGTASSAEVSCE